MSCKISIPFSEPVSSAVNKAKSAVESQNGHFQGDETSGEFDVSVMGNNIKGNYTVEGQMLHLNITDKPFFVPCSMIESFLTKQIS